MYDSNRFFDSVNDHLIAWIGTLTTRELDDYLHEAGGATDNEPQSSFASDLGRFYDHDFIYAQASDIPTSIEDLARRNFIADAELIAELSQRAGDLPVNCMLILWNAKRTALRERAFASGNLRCIGSWSHVSPLTD